MTDTPPINPVPVGLDDGYAFTKIALPDGCVFRANVTTDSKRT